MRALLLAALLCLSPACSGDGDDDDGVTVDARVVDSGASVDASTSGLKAFGASCNSGPECASGLCFNFNMDGPHCTKPCTTATAAADCAPATFGCSGMNVCKIR